ncbi:50S ribosomal protein L35 [Marinivivus vitaminiproducens]|nr:50S ribosomal protein L35 [Geminicoccaceae bacterium SCSIO 64248]
MSKLKTKRAAAKRFSFTASGKIKHKRATQRHMLTSKPKTAKKEHRQVGYIADADEGLVRRMLPYGV